MKLSTICILVSSLLAVTSQALAQFDPVSVSGSVYNDLDNSGFQNPGEPGLAGWQVNVLDAGQNVVGSALTDGSGNYTIPNLGPGSFTLAEVVQSGWIQTQPVNPDYYSFTTSSGVNIVGGIFGNFASSVPEGGPGLVSVFAVAGATFWARRRMASARMSS